MRTYIYWFVHEMHSFFAGSSRILYFELDGHSIIKLYDISRWCTCKIRCGRLVYRIVFKCCGKDL